MIARALRIERLGGRYHVTGRGNERKPVFREDSDRCHFFELLAELGPRFGARVHSYVQMENHFHLLLETPETNLSRAMQWLGVSYTEEPVRQGAVEWPWDRLVAGIVLGTEGFACGSARPRELAGPIGC